MDNNQNFEEIKERFKNASVDGKIEIYTTTQGLTVEQYKELLRMFPLKHLDELEKAMA
ncbi:hypothetical protein L0P54_06385 [Anaerosalibacter bizertensis]|uniref:Uncharacterized protein n=1 Tax=Anaerosalibacter bizertensis TaxID=932217 RepID=A0A9Q4ACA2_9FIRM|nr:hypothetical protein [Anaerosalibacter bizertensis]MBV1820362.1 hypothetical protein [Bacteroidales bacterium MSK.15.36]HHV26010.1 hypothetical protein [Tissierellia bacterium]MBU5293876.1 hypothetical protein [Anaerosalibacter bizertensis]MCB5559727.1 hypothetical protein [Anaerosalibacter bizertensis]MCG4564722.1 hypothetical protein [Anaerosalibacter bizertensis]